MPPVSQAPLTGRGDTGSPSIVGKPWPPGEQGPEVGLRTVSANYFESMGIPVVRGRAFTNADGPKAPLVIMVNQLLADRLFPGAEAIGRQITFEFAPEPREIIGIVGNEQVDALDQPLTPVLYFPERQDSTRAPVIMVRTAFPATLPLEARAALAELDPGLPLFAVRSMNQIASDSAAVFMRRTAMWLLGVFAGAALLLAAVALYGVLAQAVAERTREIGVRLALGATRASIFSMVLRRGLFAAAAGLAVGVGAALVVARLLTSLLFGIQPGDPLTLVACAVVSLPDRGGCLRPALRSCDPHRSRQRTPDRLTHSPLAFRWEDAVTCPLGFRWIKHNSPAPIFCAARSTCSSSPRSAPARSTATPSRDGSSRRPATHSPSAKGRCIPRCTGSRSAAGSRAGWGPSENNRNAKFYALTRRGRSRLRVEHANWRRYAAAVFSALDAAGSQ